MGSPAISAPFAGPVRWLDKASIALRLRRVSARNETVVVQFCSVLMQAVSYLLLALIVGGDALRSHKDSGLVCSCI